ncbi:Leaf rust 10 disease-resistance locus receptor-like protein kinase [Quillaja saponaria]|uniref:non-specific serine/threonine protein kinase n=1 Tax=Quillaja saponaria TaxID=32244 RepID=A0AAD7VCK3_QUISA|nr:Leaf rust 10 disease-resistance locus receptor-like protein kinase [Quillaja saponaria]
MSSQLLILMMILIEIPPSLTALDYYAACSSQFRCGTITADFPFLGGNRPEGCGHPKLVLKCSGNNVTIEIMNVTYRVLSLNSGDQTLRIAREDYMNGDGTCPSEESNFESTTLDLEVFDYGPDYRNISLLYGCPFTGVVLYPGRFTCAVDGTLNRDAYATWDVVEKGICLARVTVPIIPILTGLLDFLIISKVGDALRRGFDVKWKVGIEECDECKSADGVCGYDLLNQTTTCYCQGQSSGSKSCPHLSGT